MSLCAEFRHETDRLILRDWRDDADWAEFFRVTNTPAVMEWLGGVLDDAGMAAQRARVDGCAALHGHCFWAVERKEDGATLGFCGIKRADAPGSTITGEFEVGWRLREDAWGKGYAKEAAIAALDLAFGQFGAGQVVALTVIENKGSWGLMERLGMIRRADLDYEDTRFAGPPFRDTIVYAIDRAAWEGHDG